MATWTNSNRNSASFTAQTKSDMTTYGALDNSVIGSLGNDAIFHGKAIGDWQNDDPISSTNWSNQTRS